MSRLSKVFGMCAAVGALTLVLAGCVSYESTRDREGRGPDSALSAWKAGDALVAALTRVHREHPPQSTGGRYVVNLPKGTSSERAREIIEDLPAGALLPGEFGNDASRLPVYHVSRVWIRNVSARIDIAYPTRDAISGERVDGGVTVWMRGAPLPWKIDRLQYWHPGVVPTPELYVPISEDELEAQRRAYEDAQFGDAPEPAEAAQDEEPDPDPADGATYREVTGED